MSKHPIAEQPVVLKLPGMDGIPVSRDVPFAAGVSANLRMDVYRPVEKTETRLPAVVLVTGYSDLGSRKLLGCSLKEMAAYIGWARLMACSGMIAITYENEDPARDIRLLFQHIDENAASLGIDAARIGVWSCSGNVPNALAFLQERKDVACAALCYGYMMDTAGHDEVARAAGQFGFVNPTAGMQIDSLSDVPLLVARAGRDETPGLNESLDRFVAQALEANLPVSVVNHPDGPHAFDISDATERSRAAIRQILGFLKANLFA